MKRVLYLICIAIICLQYLTGCSSVKKIDFNEFYHEVIGFSDSDDLYKSVNQDAVLLAKHEDYQDFINEYFAQRELPIKTPGDNKAVIYLQFPGEKSEVTPYFIESVEADSKTITVTVKKHSSEVMVDPAPGFDGAFKWVVFLEVDRTNLKSTMDIVVKEIS